MIFDFKSTRKDDVTIYNLSGELIDRDQSVDMMHEIEKGLTNNENKIMLNMEQLRYINSSGLNVLIHILTKARKAGGEVSICCVNKKINELLLITKLNSVFNVCDDSEKAIALLNKK